MSKEKLVDFFRNSNLVSFAAAREISDLFENKSVAKNEFQLNAGRICDEYFFLEKGFMRAFAIDTEGNEVTTDFYGGGQVLFEVSSFFGRTRSKENIQAL